MIEIAYLADYRHLIPQLAQAVFLEWEEMYTFQKKSVETLVEQMHHRAVKDTLPLTLVALKEGALVGSITLKVQELENRQELSPWIAAVYVVPEYRHQGIGRQLVAEAERIAHESFGITTLYLYTATAQGLYEKSGYIVREAYKKTEGTEVVIMEKKL